MALHLGLFQEIRRERREIAGGKQPLQIPKDRILCRKIRVIRRHTVIDVIGRDVLLQFAVEFKVALARHDLDLCARLLFP